MRWLTSLPSPVLVTGWLAVAVAVAALSRVLVWKVVPAGERDHVPSIAAPMMPALGAAFAVLMALTLASEAGYLRSAHDTVSVEAAQASRLAWAATGPGIDTDSIQAPLADYLRQTRRNEWVGGVSEEGEDDAIKSIAVLERAVRMQAANSVIGTPASTELLTSLDAVTMGRRDRLAEQSREIPALYVITLIVSGAALVANAGALTFRSSARTSLLVVGLSAVVGLSLALLFAISEPWNGALVVTGQPIDLIVRDLGTGFFRI